MIAALSRRPDGAGRTALAAYAQRPFGTRLHVRVRWWSAPFPAIEAQLPQHGQVLEIGCGHGLFSLYAALAGRTGSGRGGATGRRVLGVDIDRDKVVDAAAASVTRAVTDTGADVEFGLGRSGEVPPGPWDAVVVVDMLYLLPADEQRRLLLAAARQLAAGGVLVIKEMATTPGWKATWNRFQETLSVKVLDITEGAELTFVPPSVMAGWLVDAGLQTSSRRLDRGRLHPHHLLIARVPATGLRPAAR